jgi:tRNA1(Val) A37 N6-methylase TrmN6
VKIDKRDQKTLTLWSDAVTEVPSPLTRGRSNEVGLRTGIKKLNGVTYTPINVAKMMVSKLSMEAGANWVDPACGDGTFMVAALERASELGIKFTITGWEIDGEVVEQARQRLSQQFPNQSLAKWVVHHRDSLNSQWPQPIDVVIGNPPYLESKRMPDQLKEAIRAVAPVAATGAFDLYAAFVELAVRSVVDGGTVSFIVPNRIAVTNNAAQLRSWIVSQGQVNLVDLSQDQVFPDAAVYPIVLTIRKHMTPSEIPKFSLESSDSQFNEHFLERIQGRWPLPTSHQAALLSRRICEETLNTLNDYIDFKWTVSFHKAGLREEFVSAVKPQSEFAHKFVGGARFSGNREVLAGKLQWAGAWIDYDTEKAKAAGNGLPPMQMFVAPKLVVCQNARRARAAIDIEGYVLKDTFLLGALKSPTNTQYLYWLCIVLHSDVFHIVYETLFGGTRKAGGFLHFLGSYLACMPVPVIPENVDAQALYYSGFDNNGLTKDCENIVRLAYGLTARENEWLGKQILP